MKRSVFALLAIVFVVTVALPTGSGLAQVTPPDPTWNSSIFYYNPTSDPGELQVTYFDGNQQKTGESQTIQVAAHGSGEIFVGETSATSTTQSAVLASSVPVVAVYEQSRSLADPNYGRLLYTAFDQDQSDDRLFVPDFVFDTKGYQTRVGVQNVDATGPTNIDLTFHDSAGAQAATGQITDLKYQASWVFNKTDGNFATDAFNGSLVIDANPGETKQVVAAVEQWQADGRRDYAYEAIPAKETAATVFMPTFQCRYSRGGQTTHYIVMNAGDQPTSVTVTGYDEAKRVQIGVPTAVKVGLGTTLLPNQKTLFNACEIKGATGKSGSAVVQSSNGEELAVIGKVIGSDGLTTTFTGKKEGFTTVVLPYVVWVANQAKGYRTSVSVMNVGGGNATNVRARYYQLDGSLMKEVLLTPSSKPLKPYNRVSTTPSSAKALRTDKSFRGAVEIVSDQPVIVVVRMERKISGVKGTTMLGEDYTGIPYVEIE